MRPDFMILKLSLEWVLQVEPSSAVPITCLLFNICIQFHTAFMTPFVSGLNLFQTFSSPLKYFFGYFVPLVAPEFLHGCSGEVAMPQDEKAEKSRPSLQEQKIPAFQFPCSRQGRAMEMKIPDLSQCKLWADHSNWWWVPVRNHISGSQ